MPFLELPNGGVPWNGCLVHFQSKVPCGVSMAHLGHVMVLPALNRGDLPLALGNLLLLWLLLVDHLPLLDYLLLLPFLL